MNVEQPRKSLQGFDFEDFFQFGAELFCIGVASFTNEKQADGGFAVCACVLVRVYGCVLVRVCL